MKAGHKFLVGLFAAMGIGFLLACGSISSIPDISSTSAAEPTSTLQPTLQACAGGNCTDACIAKLNSVMQASDQPLSPAKGASPHNLKTNPVILTVYQVQGDRLGSPNFIPNVPADLVSYQKATDVQQKVWEYFAAIIPHDQRKEVTQFIISSDGRGGLLASVVQFSNNPKDWALNVDIVDTTKPRNLSFTLIHEFGHLLTLNDSQITLDGNLMAHSDDPQVVAQAAASCPQYLASDGCSQPDSYLNQFFAKFWPKIYKEWTEVNAAKDESNYISLLTHFYRSHPTQFISPYAATSPEEDIAESWAYFVLTKKPADDSIAHQKVLFFYDFPEFVQLRDQIINGICNYAALDQ